jgi:hypothetical protein
MAARGLHRPSQPLVGTQRRVTAKTTIRSVATTKEGVEMPTTASSMRHRSTSVSCRTAARKPSGMPTASAKTMAASPSWSEMGKKSTMISPTVRARLR